MGTWDTGSFDNDAALDFIDGLTAPDEVIATLQLHPTDPDADEAAAMIAACECLAARLGRADPALPEMAEDLVAQLPEPDAALLDTARAAMAQVRETSELADLWSEDPEGLTAWHAALDDLLIRLDPATPYTPAPRNEPAQPPQKGSQQAKVFGSCCFCEGRIQGADGVELEHTSEDGIISMAFFAHRACVEQNFTPPHWAADGSPSPELLTQFAASLGLE